MRNKGYTFIEVLMVVAIVALLASISGPMYMQHRKRAIASEAVANMSLIRQALKDYNITSGSYFDISSGNIKSALPSSVSGTTPVPSTAGVDVDAGVAQYFSNNAFSVNAASPSSGRFSNPPAVDFLVVVNGADSVQCSGSVTDCAIHAGSVSAFDIEMDNSGRTFVSFDNGSNWSQY